MAPGGHGILVRAGLWALEMDDCCLQLPESEATSTTPGERRTREESTRGGRGEERKIEKKKRG